MDKVFVLLLDQDGTMHSSPEPFGAAVKTEDEAKKFQRDFPASEYSKGYAEVQIFDSTDAAIEAKFPGMKLKT